MIAERTFLDMDIKQDVSLKIYSSFHTGGTADNFVEVKTAEEALEALQFAEEKKLPVFYLGGGTNILFPDEGMRGLVIKNGITFIERQDNELRVGAGVYTTSLAQYAQKQSLSGIERLFGLPGTVGGAIRGNAETHKTSISDVIKDVTFINDTLELKTVFPAVLEFEYRGSTFKKQPRLITSCTLTLVPGNPDDIQKLMIETKNWRKEKQPGGFTAGSFFKNPQDTSAGYLIDQAGLKGFQIGGAQVSEKHANFLTNTGNATSKDVMMLAEHIKKVVLEKFGLQLIEEVNIIAN